MLESLDDWFIREILVHEASLMRYLRRVWADSSAAADLRQEAYARVYDAARRARPLQPKAFLFATARNLMSDLGRRSRVVSIESRGDLDLLNVYSEAATPERAVSAQQELQRVASAFDALPPRCREVVWLRRVEDLSQREVASRLGIGEGAVEKHMVKAMRRLSEILSSESHQHALGDPAAPEVSILPEEREI